MSDSSTITGKDITNRISEELYKKNKEISETLEKTKQLANLVQDEKDKLEILLENIVDIVVFLGHTGKIITVNRAFENAFGIRKEDVILKPFEEVISLYDGTRKIQVDDLAPDQIDAKQTTKNNRIIKMVGKKEIYATIALVHVFYEGDKKRTILTIHDKTKEHELEDMKLDFVSMAAHELRTPITSIRGYTSILMEELETGAKETDDWKTLLKRVNISAEQLLALVENLLNVAKIEKGILSLSCKAENWGQCIKDVVDVFTERAESKQIKIMLEDIEPTLTAFVDKMRIEEVLTNLISNAITYTGPGGNIVIKAFKNQDGFIETSVADNGPGIGKKSQSHLFEKFFRVSGPLEQGSKGNGLGLYISKSIVDMHGGKIWVESDLGKGANFIFTVPVSV